MAGLRVSSYVQLPDAFIDYNQSDQWDVRITHAAVPPRVADPLYESEFLQISRDDVRIEIAGIGSFFVHKGEEIVVEQDAASTEADVAVFLTGTVLAAILYQRGMFPMHASAVTVRDQCALFMGPSGIGKSTLAGYLSSQGFQAICDDIAVIDDRSGMLAVHPAFPRLKLSGETLTCLGVANGQLQQVRADVEKWYVGMGEWWSDRPIRPRVAYIVRSVPANHAAQVASPKMGSASLAELMAQCFRPRLAMTIADPIRRFRLMSSFADAVELYSLEVPRSLDNLQETATVLQQHWTEIWDDDA